MTNDLARIAKTKPTTVLQSWADADTREHLQMLCRHRGGWRVALPSLWRSASNLGTASGLIEPDCNCALRRRGTGLHDILVLAGLLGNHKNFASGLVRQPDRRIFGGHCPVPEDVCYWR